MNQLLKLDGDIPVLYAYKFLQDVYFAYKFPLREGFFEWLLLYSHSVCSIKLLGWNILHPNS